MKTLTINLQKSADRAKSIAAFLSQPDVRKSPPSTTCSAAFLKIMLAMCALALLAAWLKIYSMQPRPANNQPAPEVATQPEQASVPDRPAFDVPESSPAAARAYPPPPTGSRLLRSGPSADEAVFQTIQLALDLSATGTLPRGEPPAAYRVPRVRAGELQSDIGTIAGATDALVRLKAQVDSIREKLEKDRADYLAAVSATDQSGQNQRAAALRQLLDLQALYAQRKQQYQKGIASLQLTLRDPLPVTDQKLALRQQASARYQTEINQLEAAIYQLEQEVYATDQGRRGALSQLELAYKQAIESGMQNMTNATDQLRNQIQAVNTLILNYNAKLKRYGSPEL